MAKLNELEVADLSDEQLQQLIEAEKLINASRSHDIYLMALIKRE